MSVFGTVVKFGMSLRISFASVAGLLLLSGCMTPQNTVFPHFATMHPNYEQAKLRQSSPFPSSDIGPNVFGASREINQPRAFARDAAETYERVLIHQGNTPFNPNPGLSVQPNGYPQAVPNGY